jgi:hypothetical protein
MLLRFHRLELVSLCFGRTHSTVALHFRKRLLERLPGCTPSSYVLYIFDFIVVVILAIDFTIRMNASEDGRLKFVLKHWYEIPAMIPLVAFTLLENDLERLLEV